MLLCLFTSSALREPITSERSRRFAEAIPATYEAAEHAPGFIWRADTSAFVVDKAGLPLRVAFDAVPAFHADLDRVVQTLSVWSDLVSTWNYVYRGAHLEALRQRGAWMAPASHAQYVLWWSAVGRWPTQAEGVQRLDLLDRMGPGPEAFNFRSAFGADGKPLAVGGTPA